MTPNEDPTELLTIEEVAGRLKVREKTVRDWIGRGELDAYKIGKEWRVRRDHLERHIEARRVGAQPAATGGLWDPDSATEPTSQLGAGHCAESTIVTGRAGTSRSPLASHARGRIGERSDGPPSVIGTP